MQKEIIKVIKFVFLVFCVVKSVSDDDDDAIVWDLKEEIFHLQHYTVMLTEYNVKFFEGKLV